jgi:hypothetical protein
MSFSLGLSGSLSAFRLSPFAAAGQLANDPDGGNRVKRHQAGQWQNLPVS